MGSVTVFGTSFSADLVAIKTAVGRIDALELAYGLDFDVFRMVTGIVSVKVDIEFVEVDVVQAGHLDVVVLGEADCELGGLDLLSLLAFIAFV